MQRLRSFVRLALACWLLGLGLGWTAWGAAAVANDFPMAADLEVTDPGLSESTKVTFTMAAVVVFGLIVLAWGRLRWERRVVQSERSSLVAAERTRIARDLHDDIGTQLTALALQAELLRHDAPSEMAAPLQDLARQARTLSGRMSEVVWALNPSCDTLASFAGYLTDYVSQWGELTDTRFTIRVPPNLPALPMRAEARHHLALVVREALANVAKHSGATHTTLRIEIAAEILRLTVQDNGRGFDLLKVAQETPSTTGNGLRNQRARVEELGGRLELSTGPGRGTCFEVTIPLAGLQTVGR